MSLLYYHLKHQGISPESASTRKNTTFEAEDTAIDVLDANDVLALLAWAD